jgi:hypothetical protein
VKARKQVTVVVGIVERKKAGGESKLIKGIAVAII